MPLVCSSGDFLLIAEDTLSFSGSDIGVTDGEFRIVEQELSSTLSMAIDTSEDDYLFINEEGQMVYEKYFLVSPAQLENPSDVSFAEVNYHILLANYARRRWGFRFQRQLLPGLIEALKV